MRHYSCSNDEFNGLKIVNLYMIFKRQIPSKALKAFKFKICS